VGGHVFDDRQRLAIGLACGGEVMLGLPEIADGDEGLPELGRIADPAGDPKGAVGVVPGP